MRNKIDLGVFICSCGGNISDTVDVERVKKVLSGECKYIGINEHICSHEGQKNIIHKIKKENLKRIVIAACSLNLHRKVFEELIEKADINPHFLERVNIREHCSWVHNDSDAATEKAIALIKGGMEKLAERKEVEIKHVNIQDRVLVIGGGVAGITAALELSSNHEVILVEKNPYLGGNMMRLTKTYPTFDCSQCILLPKIVKVMQDPNIRIMTLSQVMGVEGHPGNYEVTVKQSPRYVNEDKCVLCGNCEKVCPVDVSDEFELGLKKRKAIYLPHHQAVPSAYCLDIENCIKCKRCLEVCSADAINFASNDKLHKLSVGAILVATGYQLFDVSKLGEFRYRQCPDVITSLELERFLFPDGPTKGQIIRLSDGKTPKRIAFLNCIGSRDSERGMPYCSKICCMYAMKEAQMLRDMLKDVDISIYYTDIRAGGKGYEEFYLDTQKKGIKFIRGKASGINQVGARLVVKAENTLRGEVTAEEFDLVVLCPALLGSNEINELAQILNVSTNMGGFLMEKYPKLHPVDLNEEGIYACGTALGPKEIHETRIESLAAATRINGFLSKGEVKIKPTHIEIDPDLCDRCGKCIEICPKVIYLEKGEVKVDTISCWGCGLCIPECEKNAIDFSLNNDLELKAEIKGVLSGAKNPILCFMSPNIAIQTLDMVRNDLDHYSSLIRVVSVLPARIKLEHILYAFELGAKKVVMICDDSASKKEKEIIRRRIRDYKKELSQRKIQSMRLDIYHLYLPQHQKLAEILKNLGD